MEFSFLRKLKVVTFTESNNKILDSIKGHNCCLGLSGSPETFNNTD
jgi:hypothetical protein